MPLSQASVSSPTAFPCLCQYWGGWLCCCLLEISAVPGPCWWQQGLSSTVNFPFVTLAPAERRPWPAAGLGCRAASSPPLLCEHTSL